MVFFLIVAPEKVKGLQVKHIRRHQGLYDIAVSWNEPILQPDNYTLQFDSFRYEPHLLTVSGVSIIAVTISTTPLENNIKFKIIFLSRTHSKLSS